MAGLNRAYLDNSATTRPTEAVIEAMAQCMRDGFYNPSSQYAPAVTSEKNMYACREVIARGLKVTPEEITFTSGGTEANNLAILGTAMVQREKGHFIVGATEHPSVLQAYDEVAKMGHRVSILPVRDDGSHDLEELKRLADEEKPVLISVMQVNNETGAISDTDRIIEIVRGVNPKARVHVDGVQGFLRVPFDARKVDFYTLSGHKLHGPKGIGALYIRKGTRILPRQIGGGQEKGLRSGTENTPGIAGLYQAVVDMKKADMAAVAAKKLLFIDLVREKVPYVLVNGPKPEKGAPHIVNLSFTGIRGEVLLHALEAKDVYCSTGSACSSKKQHVSAVLGTMGIRGDRAEGALRFSLSPLTEEEELRYAADCIGEACELLQKYKRR